MEVHTNGHSISIEIGFWGCLKDLFFSSQGLISSLGSVISLTTYVKWRIT